MQMSSLKYTSLPKYVHCNQNTNANVIPKCAFQNAHISQSVICYAHFEMYILVKIHTHFNQDANKNKLPKRDLRTSLMKC